MISQIAIQLKTNDLNFLIIMIAERLDRFENRRTNALAIRNHRQFSLETPVQIVTFLGRIAAGNTIRC
jgi:hypothetical protein